jgi:hypothetical protein
VSERSFDITVRFNVVADTPEEATGYLFDHMHRSLTGGMHRELVEVIECPDDEDNSDVR